MTLNGSTPGNFSLDDVTYPQYAQLALEDLDLEEAALNDPLVAHVFAAMGANVDDMKSRIQDMRDDLRRELRQFEEKGS